MAGLHIAALAVSLKVPVKKLEALEADRFDLLPDAVFVRALASSVCRTLKIDALPVLQLLPQTSSPKLTYQGVGINAPFRAPGDGPRPSMWAQVSHPAVLGGLVLVLGALVLILLPAARSGGADVKSEPVANASGAEPVKAPAETAVAELAIADPVKPAANGQVTLPSSTAPAARLEASPVIAESPAAAPAPVPAAVAPVAAKPAAAAASSAMVPLAGAATPASGIVVFSAKGNSWIEVTDSKGQVVLRRTLNAGETAAASGALPLNAVVGRADATQVQVRGKAFDLSGFAKDNVARFEVR